MQELILFVGANCIVLICWTVIDPQEWHTDVLDVDFFGRSVETRGYCRSANAENQNDFRNYIYWIILAVINVGSVSIAFYSAYKARNIDTKLAESRGIFNALGVTLIACFMGIPVLIIANENSTAFYFVLSAIIFLIVLSVLGFVFVPKVKHWWTGGDQRISMNSTSEAQRISTASLRVSGIGANGLDQQCVFRLLIPRSAMPSDNSHRRK